MFEKLEIIFEKCIPDRYEIKNNGRQCSDSKSDQSKKGSRAEVERILDTFQLACYPSSSFLEEELFDFCHKYLSNLDLEHYVLHLLQGAGLLVVPLLLLHLANNLHHLRSLTSSSFSAESVDHHVPEEGQVDIMS